MNRDEVIKVMADALNTPDYETGWLLDWEDLTLDRKKYLLETAEAALTALEAIMERDGLKALSKEQFYEMLDAHNKMRRDEGNTQYDVFDAAKCKLRGGE